MSKFVFEITLRRRGDHVVEGGGTDGRIVMGSKGTPNSFTPVELLLAAIAGCSGVDLCTLSERDGMRWGSSSCACAAKSRLAPPGCRTSW